MSICRINKFLRSEELDEANVRHDPSTSESPVVMCKLYPEGTVLRSANIQYLYLISNYGLAD